jgi:hypothetical protein
MMELLRNLNNVITGVFDKMAVDARIQDCLTRAVREASQTPQLSKREESVDSRKIKEPSFDVLPFLSAFNHSIFTDKCRIGSSLN